MQFASRRLDDPASVKVVAALRAVGAGRSTVQLPTMSASFRDELRAQLVAVAPRLVAEGVQPGTETAPRKQAEPAARRSASAAPARRPIRTRPMTVLVAGAAVVILGLGGATWLAPHSLPGDPLYGLKRTAESVDVSLSGSDLDKGHTLLLDASTRVDEATKLVTRPQSMALGTGTSAAGGLSDATVKLVVDTLRTADTDTHKGVTLVGDDAIHRGAADGLILVVQWANGQRDAIDSLVSAIPAGSAARSQAETSAAEIRLGLTRAEQLKQDYTDKTCRRSRDDFGPTACLTSAPTPSTPGRPSSAPTSGPTGSNPGGGATTGPAGPSTTAGATTPGTATKSTPTSTGSASRTPNAPASASPILSVGSCGVSVIGISLGSCTPTR